MKKTLDENAVYNFLSSLDTSLPKDDHFFNALKDAFDYGWHSETFVAILEGIAKAYE